MAIHYVRPPYLDAKQKLEIHRFVDDFGNELLVQCSLLTMDDTEIAETVKAERTAHCERERDFRAKAQLRGHNVDQYKVAHPAGCPECFKCQK
jgi:tRNA(Ser,Leu) C12 N-acetylase TAN1